MDLASPLITGSKISCHGLISISLISGDFAGKLAESWLVLVILCTICLLSIASMIVARRIDIKHQNMVSDLKITVITESKLQPKI